MNICKSFSPRILQVKNNNALNSAIEFSKTLYKKPQETTKTQEANTKVAER